MRSSSLGLVSSVRRAAVVALVFSSALASGGAESPGISVDSVKLRYPWNGIVDITYTLTVPAGVPPLNALTNQIEFLVTDNSVSPAATYVAADFDKVVPMTAGTHHLTWNANRNGFSFKSDNVSVTARIRTFATKYMIVDLAGGLDPDTGKYKITYADCEPEGGFTDTVYKGDKIVFRYIPPGNFLMGSPTTEFGRVATHEAQKVVALTKPFYVGIYEVTQKQYTYVKGSSPGGNKGDFRPVEKVAWTDIRGNKAWPTDKTVTSSSFVGLMRARTGIDFDLLSDAQWEYACRAGTTTEFNDGIPCVATSKNYSTVYGEHLNALGRYAGNVSDGKGGYDGGTAIVGSYKPNAWGLYDMHGNVEEWVLDGSAQSDQLADQTVDPIGVYGSYRISRGGCFSGSFGAANKCRSANRQAIANGGNGGNNFIGFRIGAPASVTDK